MEIEVTQLVEAYSRIGKIDLYYIFLGLVFLDIITGHIKAFVTRKATSDQSLRGILKHFSVIILVLGACPFLWLIGFGWAAKLIIWSFIASYGISIAENYGELGWPLSPWIRQFFYTLKDQTDNIKIEDIEEIKIKEKRP